jgi:hypothetical protein
MYLSLKKILISNYFYLTRPAREPSIKITARGARFSFVSSFLTTHIVIIITLNSKLDICYTFPFSSWRTLQNKQRCSSQDVVKSLKKNEYLTPWGIPALFNFFFVYVGLLNEPFLQKLHLLNTKKERCNIELNKPWNAGFFSFLIQTYFAGVKINNKFINITFHYLSGLETNVGKKKLSKIKFRRLLSTLINFFYDRAKSECF